MTVSLVLHIDAPNPFVRWIIDQILHIVDCSIHGPDVQVSSVGFFSEVCIVSTLLLCEVLVYIVLVYIHD